jgi:hypothetical protein
MMTITNTIRVTLAGLLLACGFAATALAGGEPKNDYPFTRQVVTERTPALAQYQAQVPEAAGEPKNEWPFTRRADDRSTSQVVQGAAAAGTGSGEAKNEAPFNLPVVDPVGTGSGGFQWGDAGIGVAAGFGLALGLAGVLLLVSHRLPRIRKTGAAAVG